MKKYTLKRIITSLFTLLAILLVLFILMQLMPGSPFNDEKLTPEMRASRPTTMVLLFTVVVRRIHAAYADVNFTMSNGFSVSPTWPPIVPRMPEIDLISVIIRVFMCIIEFHNNFTWGKDRYKNNKRRTSPKKFLVEIY